MGSQVNNKSLHINHKFITDMETSGDINFSENLVPSSSSAV